MLAVETEHHQPNGEKRTLTHVLNNEQNPLTCLPEEKDFIIQDLLKKLRAQKIKPVEVHLVDLGPVGSVFNRINKTAV